MPFRMPTHRISLLVNIPFEECKRRFTLFDEGLFEASERYICRISGAQFRIHERRIFYQHFAPSLRGTFAPEGSNCRLVAQYYPGVGVRTMVQILAVLVGVVVLIATVFLLALPRDGLFLVYVCGIVIIGLVRIVGLLIRDDRNNNAVYQTMRADVEHLFTR